MQWLFFSCQHLLEPVLLDGSSYLPCDPPARGHGLVVPEPGVGGAVSVRIRSRDDARGNLEYLDVLIGGEDVLEAERAEKPGRGDLLRAFHDVLPHLDQARQDVLPDDVIPQVIGLDLLLEVLLVPREEVAFPPAGAVELHDDRAVDLARLAVYPGQGQSRRLEPVALRVPVRLPAQDALVAVVIDLELLHFLKAHVGDEARVGDDDGVLFDEGLLYPREVLEGTDGDDLVRDIEHPVGLFLALLADDDGGKSFVLRPLEYLQRRMRTESRNPVVG